MGTRCGCRVKGLPPVAAAAEAGLLTAVEMVYLVGMYSGTLAAARGFSSAPVCGFVRTFD